MADPNKQGRNCYNVELPNTKITDYLDPQITAPNGQASFGPLANADGDQIGFIVCLTNNQTRFTLTMEPRTDL